ncbi:MAG: hypothetical protein R2724_13040 [Bryobacterales bacterium]
MGDTAAFDRLPSPSTACSQSTTSGANPQPTSASSRTSSVSTSRSTRPSRPRCSSGPATCGNSSPSGPREEIQRVWFSVFTPQIGDDLPEILTPEQRRRVMGELLELRREFPKLEMGEALIKQLAEPPKSPQDCVFARTTEVLSADLETHVTPCQFGGTPDCSACGCIASLGLSAVANHKLGGFLPVGAIFRASLAVGEAWPKAAPPPPKPAPLKVVR